MRGQKVLSPQGVFLSALAIAVTGVIAPAHAKPRETTFEVPIEIAPKRNLKAECSQLVSSQEDLDKALKVCSEAVEEKPDDGDRYFFRSYAHYYRDELDAAEADATKAIELNTSRLAKAYYLRGAIRERQRQLREAAEDFKTALDLSPDWASARRKVDSYAWAYETE